MDFQLSFMGVGRREAVLAPSHRVTELNCARHLIWIYSAAANRVLTLSPLLMLTPLPAQFLYIGRSHQVSLSCSHSDYHLISYMMLF